MIKRARETLSGGMEAGNYWGSCAFDQSSGTRQRKVEEQDGGLQGRPCSEALRMAALE